MKYLAAYALLALGGKKDISTSKSIQPLMTSSPSLDPSALTLPTRTSRELSTPSRASPSTSWSLTDRSALAPQAPHPLLPLPLLPRRRPLKNNNPRRRRLPSPRSPSPLLRKKWTWAISSVDSLVIELYTPTIISTPSYKSHISIHYHPSLI